MSDVDSGQIGHALVEFSLHGFFPEEDVSSRRISVNDLAPALELLASAKSKLESDIHKINQETAPDVSQWVANAKSLEGDISRSRSWANDIVRRSQAPDVSGQAIQEAEDKAEFLRREVEYNQRLRHALKDIKHVNELLDRVERSRDERRILDSLRLLEQSQTALDAIPISKSCRVMKLLDLRVFELKSAVHDVFDHVWNSLLRVDTANSIVTVFERHENEQMNVGDAVAGLTAYKEADQRMGLFWQDLDTAILGPRTNIGAHELPRIQRENSSLTLAGGADKSVAALFSDLDVVMTYLSERLPEELVNSLSAAMMPDLMPRIIGTWLDTTVPASLKEMDGFQQVIDTVKHFCDRLHDLKFSGFHELQEWVDDVPKVWLTKCRETALDSIRTKLALGLGETKEVERVETQAVSKSEGKELATNGTVSAGNGLDVSTEGNDDDDGTDAWGWGDDEAADDQPKTPVQQKPTDLPDEDDPMEAWGWGEEDTAETTAEEPATNATSSTAQTRELTLKETYHISSLPDPVIEFISAVLEDAASLVGNEGHPMGTAAAGLFSLPTLALAMFRAVSPYYYSLTQGGNMFLYNDASYLSERLSDLVQRWKAREDLAPRAMAMLRLDNDIQALQSFAARAYGSEMATQRTVVRDLLGSSQNLVQRPEGLGAASDAEAQVDGATAHVRATAATWSGILSASAWKQAVGALVDAIAGKIVADVMDLSGIGQDEAYDIASLIARVTELDDLFLPAAAAGSPSQGVPTTAEYAPSWLRLKYLSEVLQSNLQDVRYLWLESELSLYFAVGEVVDLIRLSFVENARTREVVREIRANPHPLGDRR
ncbi:hypothetical protein GGS23DRAFT_559980 [Durotheca rogersii]|uniref:uncharacterized protein n=1 Tax=Durotheca rogersii TaxID=419775 RepID=UPI00221F3454|nr:uncharacterized protein GGS23DRAFT_559980 [Durotheca rogersii]KAI5865603.1 hypothetical protein GGS23DRAFT_559980 [Durotheca rogersii]